MKLGTVTAVGAYDRNQLSPKGLASGRLGDCWRPSLGLIRRPHARAAGTSHTSTASGFR